MTAFTSKKMSFVLLTMAEHWSIRVLDALTTIVLIRSLDVSSFGTFAVYQSWVAILLIALPNLENILYREYSKLKVNGKLDEEIAVFRKFNLIKISIAVILILACSLLPFKEVPWIMRVSAIALAFALPLAQALYGVYREPLRFELKQVSIVVISLLQRMALIAVFMFVGRFISTQMEYISFAGLLVFLAFGIVWHFVSKAQLGKLVQKTLSLRAALPQISNRLTSVILWLHFNGVVHTAIQTLDVYFLSYSKVNLDEIAVYSIALKAANFFQVIPIPFAQVFSVYLGRRSHIQQSAKEDRKLVFLGTLGFLGVGILMYIVGCYSGEFLLHFLAKGKFSAEQLARSVEYFRWQLLGIACLLLCYAPGAYIVNRANMRLTSLTIHLPWLVATVFIYFIASKHGALSMAKANVPVYLVCSIAHFVYLGLFAKMRKSKGQPLEGGGIIS